MNFFLRNGTPARNATTNERVTVGSSIAAVQLELFSTSCVQRTNAPTTTARRHNKPITWNFARSNDPSNERNLSRNRTCTAHFPESKARSKENFAHLKAWCITRRHSKVLPPFVKSNLLFGFCSISGNIPACTLALLGRTDYGDDDRCLLPALRNEEGVLIRLPLAPRVSASEPLPANPRRARPQTTVDPSPIPPQPQSFVAAMDPAGLPVRPSVRVRRCDHDEISAQFVLRVSRGPRRRH